MASATSRTVKVRFDGDAKGLKRATDQGERELSKFQKAAGKLKGFGGKAAKMLGAGLKAGALAVVAIGVAVGAAVVKGVQEALAQGQIKATLAAQLGADGADAKRLGKLAGKVFKDGWGETFGEAAGLVKTVFEQGLVSLKNTDKEIQDITGSVATYTTLTGEDATAATRAVSQMLKTGLAPNAKAAFDVLVKGQQLGINKSEDLLDTFNEYGTHFRKLGLSATDSLGLMNQLIRGGARDSDVAADAIKEFSIRAVDGSKSSAAAFKGLGLDSKQMFKEFAEGGPQAKTAFNEVIDILNAVKDPLKRNTIGVALFGTQWEDLGGAFKSADLDTAAASVGKVAGATDKANAALSNAPAAKLERVKRLIMQTFVDALGKYALPYLDKFATWFEGPGKFAIVEWALSGADAVLGFTDTMLSGLQNILRFVGKWGKAFLYSMAATVAFFNPSLALSMKKAGDDVGGFADRTIDELEDARGGIKKTQDFIAKAKLVTKLTATKEDLDRKIATAKEQLKDPKLSATKKANLTAKIAELLAQKAKAQASIDSLHGKTVAVNIVQKYSSTGVNLTSPSSVGRRASGGLTQPRRTYLVGERGPELVTMGSSPARVTSAEASRSAGSDQPLIVENHIEIGGEVVRVIRTEIKQSNRDLKRTVGAR